jgi:hypothetical protein
MNKHVADETKFTEDGFVTESKGFGVLAASIEFVCWTVTLLMPILRLVNGPAVTNDQFAVQIAITSLAFLGGCSLRLLSLMRR